MTRSRFQNFEWQRTWSSARLRFPVLLLPLVLLVVSGCGRPATEKECDEIVVRITELELEAQGAAGDDAVEIAQTREALRKTTLRDCVGRRISDEAMACVRSATSAEQIVEECF